MVNRTDFEYREEGKVVLDESGGLMCLRRRWFGIYGGQHPESREQSLEETIKLLDLSKTCCKIKIVRLKMKLCLSLCRKVCSEKYANVRQIF